MEVEAFFHHSDVAAAVRQIRLGDNKVCLHEDSQMEKISEDGGGGGGGGG